MTHISAHYQTILPKEDAFSHLFFAFCGEMLNFAVVVCIPKKNGI
jgi:hypothetical protein